MLNLNLLLSYKNDQLIDRYNKDYPNAKLKAQEALEELMKYIWLTHKHQADKKNNPNNNKLDFVCVMHEEMLDIDYMWHTFLLFTRDYQDFCRIYLNGHFFHHYPTANTHKSISPMKAKRELTHYLNYIYDHLGEETLLKWFQI